MSAPPSADTRNTYCRLCEAYCGIVATVEGGVVTKIAPDRDHPVSRGAICPKGIGFVEVQNDPQRVLYPLRRKTGVPKDFNGEVDEMFERVSWDEALDDIGARMRVIIKSHGGSSIGAWEGTPSQHSFAASGALATFVASLGSIHHYGVTSQDHAARFAASSYLYGNAAVTSMPDLVRTEMVIIFGANPLVSHGSLMNGPNIVPMLRDIVRRGGRVIAVDPRRTETARAFEHVPVRVDTDSWLMLSMAHVIFEEGLEAADSLDRTASGTAELREVVAAFAPEVTAERTGVDPETVRELARALAGAERAAVYGRVGVSRGRHGTLASALVDVLNVITGNLDVPGGAVFGLLPFLPEVMDGHAKMGQARTRIGDLPEVFTFMPTSQVAKEIWTEGPGQLRALIVQGGNPIQTSPNSDELAEAFSNLDLLVTIDIYVSDTGRYADYILPATTMLERWDMPAVTVPFAQTPYVEWSDPVVPPSGEARQEWVILDDIASRSGFVSQPTPKLRALRRLGIRVPPYRLVDRNLRRGPYGDKSRAPGPEPRPLGTGVSIRKLRKMKYGVVLANELPTGVLAQRVRHEDGRVCLNPPELMNQIKVLGERHDADVNEHFPLRMIGMREMRGANSSLHNSPMLMRGRVHLARINPLDAVGAGVADGDTICISSATGSMELTAKVTDEMIQGAVAVPHGWGHTSRGWKHAHAAGGGNYNRLVSTRIEDIEKLAGMTLLDGVPIRVDRVTDSQAITQGVGDAL